MKLHPLKVEREQRGWSQSKVAEMLGTTTRTVIRWEQGDVVPYPYYREQLCTVYGKSAKQLGLVTDESLQQDSFEDQESMPVELELPPEIPTSFSPSELTQQAFLLDPTIPEMLGRAGSLLGREHLLVQIKHRLLGADNSPSLALNGLPGIGKTALAVALALDEEVQASFQDGILWAELGPQPDVLGQLARWGALLEIPASQVENLHSPEAWGKALQAVIGQRHLLLVIDDAWTAEDAFALRVGGPHCTYLLTTRLPQVALAFAGEKVISVAELEEADGLSLLARFVPQLVEQDPKGAQVLVSAMGGLPLGLTLMGKYLALQALTQQPRRLQAALVQVHDAKQRLRVSMPMAPGERTTNLPSGIPPSLYATIAVSDQQLSLRAHAALCALAAFPPKPSSFSEEEALIVSQQPVEVLDELWDTGLLESYGTGRYTLHQTVVDYARALSEGSVDQEPLSGPTEKVQYQKEESKYETLWQQSLHDVSTGYNRRRLALDFFSHASGHLVSMIAMGSLCIIVILALSIFNSVQSRFFGLPMPAGSASTLISLAKYMNNKGISTIPGQANFDGSGFSYPADQLPHPGQVTLNGQQYLFPANAPGVNDNVVALGQTISIPPGHSYQQAFLLVAGSWGLLSTIVTVHYTDGSTVLASLSVPDWRVGPSGIVNTSYRYTPTDLDQGSVHIYAVQIELDPTKTVSSLTLPRIGQPGLTQPCLHIFALTLQS